MLILYSRLLHRIWAISNFKSYKELLIESELYDM